MDPKHVLSVGLFREFLVRAEMNVVHPLALPEVVDEYQVLAWGL